SASSLFSSSSILAASGSSLISGGGSPGLDGGGGVVFGVFGRLPFGAGCVVLAALACASAFASSTFLDSSVYLLREFSTLSRIFCCSAIILTSFSRNGSWLLSKLASCLSAAAGSAVATRIASSAVRAD